MDLNLNNRNALVMGSSKGIGRGIAESLIREGTSTTICSRNESLLMQTGKEIGAKHCIIGNLNQAGEATRIINETNQKMGPLDILVINSGGPAPGSFEDVSLEKWQDSFQGLWLMTVESIKAVLPHMKKQKWGRILIVTSVAAKEPIANLTTSNGLRAGIHGLVKSLCHEVAELGITINCIMPGYTDTERIRELGVPLEKITSQIPANRMGKPSELGDLATFLASDRAAYITGQMISVDGGYLKGY